MSDTETRQDLLFEIHYGRRYALIQGRFFDRIATLMTFTAVMSGAAAFTAVIKDAPTFSAYFGLFSAALAAIDLAYGPSKKAALCDETRRKFFELERDCAEMDDVILRKRVLDIQAGSGPEIECLRIPAFNDVCREEGRPNSVERLSLMQWLFACLA